MEFTFRNPARSTEPQRILRSAASLFVGTRGYEQSVVGASAADRHHEVPARIARYASADHYGRLEHGLGAMAEVLRSLGHRAVVVADKNDVVDREAAYRAGIGWYGKNSLLLASGVGSWFVIGSVVTDAIVTEVAQPVPDGCGGCTKCLDGCPTTAIVAPGVVDAGRCLSWLLQAPGEFPLEFRRTLGDRIYGCDDCQEVCPPNRTVELRSRRIENWPTEHDPGTWIGACELLEVDDEELLRRCARWYIAGRDPSIVRRNLLIVLSNVIRSGGVPADAPAAQRAAGLINEYRSNPDPVLAGTADWAAGEIDGHLATIVSDGEDGRR